MTEHDIEEMKRRIEALESKVKALILAGNAMSYELQDTDPDVRFDTIKVWKQSVRQ